MKNVSPLIQDTDRNVPMSAINCKRWFIGTAKVVFVSGCFITGGAALTGTVWLWQTYAKPVLIGHVPEKDPAEVAVFQPQSFALPPKQNVIEPIQIDYEEPKVEAIKPLPALPSVGEGSCYRYVPAAAKILPTTSLKPGDPSPKAILHGLVSVESSGNPLAVSETGAKGCGQIMKRWHPDAPKNLHDAKANTRYAAQYLAELVEQHGGYWAALRHYNGCVPANDCNTYAKKVWRAAKQYQSQQLTLAAKD